MRGRRRMVAVALVLALPGAGDSSVVRRPAAVGKITEAKGLTLRLGEARGDAPPAPAASPATKGEPLSAADTARVLARLPELSEASEDEKDFALREKSLPPPRTGHDGQGRVPASADGRAPPAETVAGPLTVVRRDARGRRAAGAAALRHVLAADGGGHLARRPRARARCPCASTRSRRASGAGSARRRCSSSRRSRFPMATEFRVEVPAGTRSATGGTLATAVRWTFATPPLVLERRHPEDAADAPPAGDLRVVRPARSTRRRCCPTVTMRAARPGACAWRRAEEVAAGRGGRAAWPLRRPRAAGSRSCPASRCPPDAAVTVTVGRRHAARPRARARPRSRRRWSFRTFGAADGRRAPLRLERPVPAGHALADPVLEPARRRPRSARDMVRVTPELPGPEGRRQRAVDERAPAAPRGAPPTASRSRRRCRDVFGQTLGAPQTLTFTVGSAEPSLYGQDRLRGARSRGGPALLGLLDEPRRRSRSARTRSGPSDWPAFAHVHAERLARARRARRRAAGAVRDRQGPGRRRRADRDAHRPVAGAAERARPRRR